MRGLFLVAVCSTSSSDSSEASLSKVVLGFIIRPLPILTPLTLSLPLFSPRMVGFSLLKLSFDPPLLVVLELEVDVVDEPTLLELLLLLVEDVEVDEVDDVLDEDVEDESLLFLPVLVLEFSLEDSVFSVSYLPIFPVRLLLVVELSFPRERLFDLFLEIFRSEAIPDLPLFLDLLGGESDGLLVLERPLLGPSSLNCLV